ncbi:Hypothetical predicted protein [Podarcis lilfordi]|uniref:Uncharacterized protein n=1 Tax=Podarcis lilfordi TaxID=74358 RepID=A0AA35P3U3_9SAUR|nr:Hypothetical predicted protein [Podarcis lilfordi]
MQGARKGRIQWTKSSYDIHEIASCFFDVARYFQVTFIMRTRNISVVRTQILGQELETKPTPPLHVICWSDLNNIAYAQELKEAKEFLSPYDIRMFLHGPASGVKELHDTIQQLNLRKCNPEQCLEGETTLNLYISCSVLLRGNVYADCNMAAFNSPVPFLAVQKKQLCSMSSFFNSSGKRGEHNALNDLPSTCADEQGCSFQDWAWQLEPRLVFTSLCKATAQRHPVDN